MVVQQFIKLCNSLQVSNLGRFLVTDSMAEKIKIPLKISMAYSCSGLIYLRPKVTLHCLFIYLFRIFVSDI